MRTRRLVAALVVAVSLLTLVHYVAVWSRVTSGQMRTSDYTSTYVAAQTWRSGDGAHLYDTAVQAAGHRALGTPPSVQVSYVNPPLGAVLASPFSLVGYVASYRAFAVAQVLLIVAAVVVAVRAAPWPRSVSRLEKTAFGLLAVAGTGTGEILLQAQWDGVIALGLALAYAAWRRERPGWAGFTLVMALGVTKPHLAFGLAAFLIARGERRALGGAALAVLIMGLASFLLVGVHGSLAFLSAPSISESISPLADMLGFPGLVFSNLQPGILADVLAAGGVAVAVALAAVLGRASGRRPELLEPALAGAVAMTLLSAPHLLVHDLVLLAPVLVWCFARAADRVATLSLSRSELGLIVGWIALAYAALVDVGRTDVGAPGRLVPWLLLIGAAWSVLTCRRPAFRRPALAPVAARAARGA